MIVTVITPAYRLPGALAAARSIQAAAGAAPEVELRHVIAYWRGEPDYTWERFGPWLTAEIQAARGWVMFVDDDNLMHPAALATLSRVAAADPEAEAFVFASDYWTQPGGVLWPQLPPRVGHIDGGQVALRAELARRVAWPAGGCGDGHYLRALYDLDPSVWRCIPEVVTSWNAQRRGG